MKMFRAPTDKTCEKMPKGCRVGAFGGFGTFCQWRCRYFEISMHGHFRKLSGRPHFLLSPAYARAVSEREFF